MVVSTMVYACGSLYRLTEHSNYRSLINYIEHIYRMSRSIEVNGTTSRSQWHVDSQNIESTSGRYIRF